MVRRRRVNEAFGTRATRSAGRSPPASSGTCRLSPPVTGSRRRLVYSQGARRSTMLRPAPWRQPDVLHRHKSVGVRHVGGRGLLWASTCSSTVFELTTVWSINAAFEHLWTPSLKTSWYGSYIDVSHSGAGAIAICNGNTALGVHPDVDWPGLQPGLDRLDRRLANGVGAGQGSHLRCGRDLSADQFRDTERCRRVGWGMPANSGKPRPPHTSSTI